MPRAPKKSETLEVRLSHQAKTAFAARCEARGTSVSEAVRGFIEREIGARPGRARPAGWRMLLTAVLLGLGLGAVSAPALAEGLTRSHDRFVELDRNHDGVLSPAEFQRR